MINIIYAMHSGPRSEQEDALLVGGKIIQEADLAPVYRKISANIPFIAAVCDGMGGHARGQWASSFVCERLSLQPTPKNSEEILARLRSIQKEMAPDAKHGDRTRAPEGTTMAGLLMNSQGVLAFNTGDSRVYHLSNEGGCRRVSQDHTLVQSLVDKGRMTLEEARVYPYRNIVEFGFGPVFTSAWKGGHFAPHIEHIPVNEGVWLVCSDGVHGVLEDKEIVELLTPPSTEGADKLVKRLESDASDNFSFILLWKS
ncbi:MAG: serine/threonine-protein phosphatase [Magnetococcales bacterium]|nr:serine/threonine-protein phosphatase [Magnetococcales bacterium]